MSVKEKKTGRGSIRKEEKKKKKIGGEKIIISVHEYRPGAGRWDRHLGPLCMECSSFLLLLLTTLLILFLHFL
jgi:hypothetical protein